MIMYLSACGRAESKYSYYDRDLQLPVSSKKQASCSRSTCAIHAFTYKPEKFVSLNIAIVQPQFIRLIKNVD